MIDEEFFLTVRLSDDRMRHREYKTAHRPASLRASSAAALAWLSEPREDDVVLDPFCGAGTILIERAHMGRYAMLLGSDRDAAALAAARVNVGERYKPIQLENWDAGALPLGDASVDKIVTNLPWGLRYGSHGENRKLYPTVVQGVRARAQERWRYGDVDRRVAADARPRAHAQDRAEQNHPRVSARQTSRDLRVSQRIKRGEKSLY